MSQGALLKAVRNQLQTTFTLTDDSCEVGFDGKPKPACGEFYVAVHPLSWTPAVGDWDLAEEYQIGVTLTMRMGFAPRDRWGIAVWLASQDGENPAGLEQRLRRAITAIHHNQALRAAAGVFLGGGFYFPTPLQLLRVDPPKPQGPDWFTAALPEERHEVAESGVSQMIAFGKCQRHQSIPEME